MKEEKKKKRTGPQESALPPFGLAEEVLGQGPPEKDPGRVRGPGNGLSGDEALMKFVTFFLEKEEYALPISQVQEIDRVGEITRVPNSPGHVMGVINLRGKIVPVIELKRRLKLGEANLSRDSRIVVVEQGPKVLGLLVDRVAQVLNLSAGQIEEAPEEVVQIPEDYIKGVGKIDQRLIILLDLERVVGKEAAL